MAKNDKTVTIKDIAAMCGVSISTVSNVLNGRNNKVGRDVAQKIRDAVEATGYKPNYLAKSLRAASTRTIGVIAEELVIFSTAPMIEGLMRYCEENGYSVVIENMRLFGRWNDNWMHDEKLYRTALSEVMDKMNALNVDGLVYIGSYEHIVNFSREDTDLPMVMLYSRPSDETIPCFVLDDETGGYMAYEYLLGKGHRRIGVIAGEADNIHTINRLRGINRAMFKAGQLYDPSLIEYRTWNKEGGYAGIKNLMDQGISAVFCMSDKIASGVYEYLYEKGLKPGKDLSVLGYDNHELTYSLTPTLSTVELPLEKLGYEAAGRAVEMINDPLGMQDAPGTVCIIGGIIERESVADISGGDGTSE